MSNVFSTLMKLQLHVSKLSVDDGVQSFTQQNIEVAVEDSSAETVELIDIIQLF